MIDRRSVLAALALPLGACVPLPTDPTSRITAHLRLIEVNAGGKLGVFVHDTGTGLGFGHRSDELFALCSTFKASLAALVLSRARQGELDLNETLRWSEDDLLGVSPFSTERVATGASLQELARAIQLYSDNTAANLLLRHIGGPGEVTRFWRSHGDQVSRLDHYEYELNNVPEGDVEDTTSPRAMATTLAQLLYAQELHEEDQATLKQWMEETRTGLRRTRGGFPVSWPAGDKTGTSGAWPGMGSVHADIGYVEPPGRPALTYAAYHQSADSRSGVDPTAESALRDVGEAIVVWAAGWA